MDSDFKRDPKRQDKLDQIKENASSPRKFWLSDQEAYLGIVVGLVIIGTLNIFTSSFFVGIDDFGTPYFFLKKHGLNLLIAFVAFYAFQTLDYHKIRHFIVPATLTVIVMLGVVLVHGEAVNGAQRWLRLGFITLQPSEFAKLITILIAAAQVSQKKRREPLSFMSKDMAIYFVFWLLVEIEPDGATAAVVAGVPIFIYLCAPLPIREKKFALGAIPGIGILICIIQPYRLRRLMALFDPWGTSDDIGYQVVQSISAIGSGRLFGMGIGHGISKYNYLPEAHTDFAFSIWCQETGFLGALAVFILYSLLVFYGFRISNRAHDSFGQYLAAGITFLIAGQGVVNMLMIAGFFPVVGIPLPFISYGGSSLLVTMMAVGIMSNICKQTERSYRG